MFDLGIEGGTLVTGAGRMPAHLYVSGGRIAAVSAERLEARERVDASGLLVMPGMIDTHVHLMDPGDETREDFPSGTAAAARAGVTTIIEHTHSGAVREVADLQAKVAHLADRSRVDFGLAAHAFPDRIDQVEPSGAPGRRSSRRSRARPTASRASTPRGCVPSSPNSRGWARRPSCTARTTPSLRSSKPSCALRVATTTASSPSGGIRMPSSSRSRWWRRSPRRAAHASSPPTSVARMRSRP
ncbi:amidohydrolase family protein [Homoserinibacter gongjuensis]|uniref:amidohydrolase family protein n=1 Tax=Homoserinibacter gongjuensis TaxID=1162968 RepID=UPI0024E0A9E7|nr:amidohydrolase family protein [Homoserinibacter gongjuensis]